MMNRVSETALQSRVAEVIGSDPEEGEKEAGGRKEMRRRKWKAMGPRRTLRKKKEQCAVRRRR